jgi:hypothetical protein
MRREWKRLLLMVVVAGSAVCKAHGQRQRRLRGVVCRFPVSEGQRQALRQMWQGQAATACARLEAVVGVGVLAATPAALASALHWRIARVGHLGQTVLRVGERQRVQAQCHAGRWRVRGRAASGHCFGLDHDARNRGCNVGRVVPGEPAPCMTQHNRGCGRRR